MPQVAPLDALLDAYRSEIGWLLDKAKEFEEKQPLVAADYIHRARNLQAIIEGYGRIDAKRTDGHAVPIIQETPDRPLRS